MLLTYPRTHIPMSKQPDEDISIAIILCGLVVCWIIIKAILT